MLYINLYDLCQNCLVLIITTFWVQVLEGCLTEELGKEPVSGHRAELLECVPGPFPRGGSCQSWDRSHQKWRATYLESRQRKETACLCLNFLKWCGTDSPFVYMYFTAVRDWNQYPPLTLMDLHQVRRETWALCSLPMHIFSLCETNPWENALPALQWQGFLIWSYPMRALCSDQVHQVTHQHVWFPSRLRLTAWHERLSAWYLHVVVTRLPV